MEMIYPKALELPPAMSEAYQSVHEVCASLRSTLAANFIGEVFRPPIREHAAESGIRRLRIVAGVRLTLWSWISARSSAVTWVLLGLDGEREVEHPFAGVLISRTG
jgi:hypothetical protein